MNEKDWLIRIYSEKLKMKGTGFLIGEGKYIFSCAHVFLNKEKKQFLDLKDFEFKTINNEIVEIAEIVENEYKTNDFVLIELKNKIDLPNIPKINFNFNYSIYENLECKAIGYGEEENNEPTAIVFKLTDKIKTEGVVLINDSRPVIGGDSGSPVLIGNEIIGWLVARANYQSGEDKKQIFTGFIQFFSNIKNITNKYLTTMNLNERKQILEQIIGLENGGNMNINLKNNLLDLIENNDFEEIFNIFRENKTVFKNYKNFEDEFTYENIEGLKLKKFRDRLKVFVNSCLK